MLNSVLLHLNGMEHGQSVIECGVGMAQRWEARVRGLTLLDTIGWCVDFVVRIGLTPMENANAASCRTAAGDVRSQLTQACLSAGVDFDVRRMQGDPFDLLPPESQFHDLMVTYLPPPGEADELQAPGMNAAELVNLLIRGVQPMLIVRRPRQELRRVLLAYDGTPASGQASGSSCSRVDRLAGVSAAGDRPKRSSPGNLREMTEYCASYDCGRKQARCAGPCGGCWFLTPRSGRHGGDGHFSGELGARFWPPLSGC